MAVEDNARVALVSMPWAPVTEPPLGLSILRACLSEANIPSRLFHFNLSLLKYLRYETYVQIADLYAINEFVFTRTLDNTLFTKHRFNELLHGIGRVVPNPEQKLDLAESIMRVRQLVVPSYLEDCTNAIAAESPTLVGFTCSFDQTIAAIALAKLIKQRLRNVLVVLGGYAVNGETGEMLLHSFPFIDCVAQGDSESTIIDLADASIGRRSLFEVSGIQYRSQSGRVRSRSALRKSLDSIPFPDFRDFYRDKLALEKTDDIQIKLQFLPVETSRGCWWGQKHHCVFCGIDEITMKYRSRTVDNVIRMLDTLHKRHEVAHFRINDYILPHSYHKTLIPMLAAQPRPYEIACEAKANLTPDQVRNLSRARFTEVQPGIESFSSHVLTLMKKGVTASQNVLLLTLARRFGVKIHYNVLYGIPGERVDDYRKMAKLIPALYHLDPPSSVTIAFFTRYSPLQEGRVEGSTGSTEPARQYRVLFSDEFVTSEGFEIEKYCYYFETTYQPTRELKAWHKIVSIQCNYWARLHKERRVNLSWREKGDEVTFFDSRWHSDGKWITGDRNLLDMYRLLSERPLTRQQWKAKVEDAGFSESSAMRALEFLVENRIVVEVDKKLVALAQNEDGLRSFQKVGKSHQAAAFDLITTPTPSANC